MRFPKRRNHMKTHGHGGTIMLAMPAEPALSALSERVDMPKERIIELADEHPDGPASLGIAIQALELMHDGLVDEMERLDSEEDDEEPPVKECGETGACEENRDSVHYDETREDGERHGAARGKLGLAAGATAAAAAVAALCCIAMRLRR